MKKERKKHILITASVAILAAVPAFPSPPAGYKLVWSEEFDAIGQTPDPKHWTYDLGHGPDGWGNQELENYVNDREHAVIVSDKNATDGAALQISATREESGEYRSARLKTEGRYAPQYGFIEARIRRPEGQGIWPAFWMLGANFATTSWPACGEVDIMESPGKLSWSHRSQGVVHDPAYYGAEALKSDFILKGKPFSEGYHLFQVKWEKDNLEFFVDGLFYERRTAEEIGAENWTFNHPMFFLLNVAVGGQWPGNPDQTTVFPQHMMVDYIRVYQKAE